MPAPPCASAAVPTTRSYCAAAGPQVVPPGVGPERIELQADERVSSGGAIVETTHGQVDAQLESKLTQLGNALWTFVMDVSAAQDKDDVDA